MPTGPTGDAYTDREWREWLESADRLDLQRAWLLWSELPPDFGKEHVDGIQEALKRRFNARFDQQP